MLSVSCNLQAPDSQLPEAAATVEHADLVTAFLHAKIADSKYQVISENKICQGLQRELDKILNMGSKEHHGSFCTPGPHVTTYKGVPATWESPKIRGPDIHRAKTVYRALVTRTLKT